MFLKFVRESRQLLNSKKLKWFVMGNDASDLDSIVCSLVYAYYKQKNLGDNCVVIPVCCIKKCKITLKRDVFQWLQRFNLDPLKDLVYLEEIKELLCKNLTKNNIKICLVDHHKPQITTINQLVCEVIDHRQIVYHYPKGQLSLNNIELVGSCATLIATYIMEMSEFKDKSILLLMLRGVILLDTDCLGKNNSKTTEKDVYIVESIENCLGLCFDTRLEIYNFLCLAKSDISGFSLSMMVERDLKILEFDWNGTIVKIAISTLICIDIEDLLAINDLQMQLEAILKDLDVNFIIGLTCGNSVHCRRGYLMFSNNNELNSQIYDYLKMPEQALELHELIIKDSIKCFYQSHLLTLRKNFIPFIENFFNVEKQNQCNNSKVSSSYDLHSFIKTHDAEIVIEVDEVTECEGAPYTLNTPLRSYSGSPDNRISDMVLPSLNNRYTLQLVDKKRRKHNAEMDVEVNCDDNNQDIEIVVNDDKSSSAFTPENSDDESIDESKSDSNEDNIGPLPLLTQSLSVKKIEQRRVKLSEHKKINLLSKSKTPTTYENNSTKMTLSDSKSNNLFNCGKENIHDTEINSLIDKVDKKRQKLHSTRIDAIANTIVNDVMNKSKDIILEEKDFELMLNDWSECYTHDEKKQILSSVYSNNFTKLAELLTSSLIRECLNVPEIVLSTNELDNTKIIIDTELCIDETYSLTREFNDIDDNGSLDSLEPIMSNLENNYDKCHLGNIINKENQCIHSSSVNSSSADVVENISFNLYRRISTNQLDYSEDEKELLNTAGDWLPKEEIIYSDIEQDDCSESHSSRSNDCVINEILEKDNLSTDQICSKSSKNLS